MPIRTSIIVPIYTYMYIYIYTSTADIYLSIRIYIYLYVHNRIYQPIPIQCTINDFFISFRYQLIIDKDPRKKFKKITPSYEFNFGF